uniref:HD1 protein n=1 Tax=Volvariella volvacea TaxID=36659 RepID=A0A1B2U731_9AGAR|nr:HD1 protein [Volvariella volvacea]
MDTLRTRLLRIDANICDALSTEKPEALDTFQEEWLSIVDQLSTLIDADSLPEDMINLAHVISTRVLRITEAWIALQEESEKIQASFNAQLDAIALDDSVNENTTAPSARCQTDATSISAPSPPAYISVAYTWLLQNLHNPYPSMRVKDSIAKSTGTNRKDIEAWFVDARKRIGWNALRKELFNNKMADIVAAATAFYLHREYVEGAERFVKIRSKAQALYSAKVAATPLATDIELNGSNIDTRHRNDGQESVLVAYPSPASSPSGSPEPLETPDPTGLSSRHLDIQPLLVANVASSTEAHKSISIQGLPSPAPSPRSPNEYLLSEPLTPPVPPVSMTPDNSRRLQSRKRRLSDADVDSTAKRTRYVPQATTKPLSNPESSFDLDEWLQQTFNIPNSVTVDEPDLHGPMDVRLYEVEHYSGPLLGPTLTDEQSSTSFPINVSFDAVSLLDSLNDELFGTSPSGDDTTHRQWLDPYCLSVINERSSGHDPGIDALSLPLSTPWAQSQIHDFWSQLPVSVDILDVPEMAPGVTDALNEAVWYAPQHSPEVHG